MRYAHEAVRDRRQPFPNGVVSRWGIALFAIARVADTIVSAPVLLVHPAAELNPIAVWIASTFGVGGYVAASLFAIPVCILLVEGLTRVDWPRGTHGTWNTAAVKALAYGLLTAASAAAAVWNAHQLATVLAGVVL